MSYYDPKIYNSKNLHKEDQTLFRFADIMVRDLLRAELTNCTVELEEHDCSTLERIQIEERLNLLKELWENYKVDRLETMVSIMDCYDINEETKDAEPDDLGELDDPNFD